MLIDTHCHLDFPEFDQDRDEVVRRAQEKGVSYIINIGSSLNGSLRSVELSRGYDNVYAAVGIHPHEADGFSQEQRLKIEGLAKEDKVVAIGEVGLDYYKNYSKRENQKGMFISLASLARETGLPLIVHSRQAEDETLKALREIAPPKVVVHCFSGNETFLKECLDLGFFVSFTCNITYKKADGLRKLVKAAPLARLLLETDAPFLPPEGLRGRRNEPVYIVRLAQEIAGIKGIDAGEVERVTTANAKDFFKIK